MPSLIYSPRVSLLSDRKSQSMRNSDNKLYSAENPNQRICTRPTPAPWADSPCPLIRTPRKEMHSSGVLYVATEMAHIHNVLLRGLNSIIRQAPYIPDASNPDYNAEDVRDLLFYVRSWCKTLEHHHQAEDTIFFPQVERVTGVIELMDELEEQHEEFEEGLTELQLYVEKVHDKPHHYRWATMKTLICAFAPALVHHLHDEIDFLLSMDQFDGEVLRRCWLDVKKAFFEDEDHTMLYEILPFILGNSDKTFEGGNDFPQVPKHLRYKLKLWLKKKHRGAWRFNCCDWSGKPLPLQMLPENRNED